MSQLRSTTIFSFFLLQIFLLSCNGGADKTSSETSMATDSPKVTSTEPAPAPAKETSTITTSPQAMVVIRQRVANYAKWLPMYEAHDSVRRAYGLHNYVLGRGVKDTNIVLVALKADDMGKAKQFSKLAELKQVMQKAGVVGAPTMQFFTSMYQDTLVLATPIRSMAIVTVKDVDAWHKAFEDSKQERMDNGITTRVVGHDADNEKKIVVVTALLDTAKANAYMNSDAMKKRREAAGVVGTPERFIFSVTKRY